jgi:GTP-binding protein
MDPLFQTIIDKVTPPAVDVNGPFQMQITMLDYSSYVGTIGIGRIARGTAKTNMPVTVINREGKTRQGRILQVLGHMGLKRLEVPSATAGDIVCITGIEGLNVSDTVCDPNNVEALAPLSVDEPTVTMTFQVNNSPFAGRDGKYITSRHLRDRLFKELIHNVALRVKETGDPDKFQVSGRGELHLAILIENMRREGYELAVSRPEVIMKEVDGEMNEPFEFVTIDIEDQHQGAIMEKMGMRQGDLKNMVPDGKGRVRLEYIVPTRGLIGFHTEFLSSTSGTGILNHVFDHYGPCKKNVASERQRGVLISNQDGKALGYALFNLQERGQMMIEHGTEVYEGMVVGLNSRDDDMVVNVIKGKQLTNIRAAGTDENIVLTPPIKHTLEQALEFINDDELVEVTPKFLRIRKRFLKETDRRKAERSSK